jgi:hypothetical protein
MDLLHLSTNKLGKGFAGLLGPLLVKLLDGGNTPVCWVNKPLLDKMSTFVSSPDFQYVDGFNRGGIVQIFVTYHAQEHSTAQKKWIASEWYYISGCHRLGISRVVNCVIVQLDNTYQKRIGFLYASSLLLSQMA